MIMTMDVRLTCYIEWWCWQLFVIIHECICRL